MSPVIVQALLVALTIFTLLMCCGEQNTRNKTVFGALSASYAAMLVCSIIFL